MTTVDIEKQDVYGDGEVNTSLTRASTFVFKTQGDAVVFTEVVRKALGVIRVTINPSGEE